MLRLDLFLERNLPDEADGGVVAGEDGRDIGASSDFV